MVAGSVEFCLGGEGFSASGIIPASIGWEREKFRVLEMRAAGALWVSCARRVLGSWGRRREKLKARWAARRRARVAEGADMVGILVW